MEDTTALLVTSVLSQLSPVVSLQSHHCMSNIPLVTLSLTLSMSSSLCVRTQRGIESPPFSPGLKILHAFLSYPFPPI